MIWENGALHHAGRVDMTRTGLEGFGKSLRATDDVVIEATGKCIAVSRVLSPFVKRVAIANPLQVICNDYPACSVTVAGMRSTVRKIDGCTNVIAGVRRASTARSRPGRLEETILVLGRWREGAERAEKAEDELRRHKLVQRRNRALAAILILTLAAGAGAWWAGELDVLDEVFRTWSTG